MEKNKDIWVLLRSHISSLPPVMSVIQCLLSSERYNVKLISTQRSGLEHSNLVEYIIDQEHNSKKTSKIINYISYRNYVSKVTLKYSNQDDLFWIASLDTAVCCLNLSFIKTNSYILHLHELYDTYPRKLSLVKTVAQKAKAVVVPEENRAGILQVWLDLSHRPVVLPNKPFKHPRLRMLTPTTQSTKTALEKVDLSKRIIIYQGHIGRDRNLEPIIEAVDKIDNVEFWLMGIDHGYVSSLLRLSNKVKYLGYIPAPYHLEITSYADVGILSYDLVNLNNLYCAPNKVWEYLGFDIFFICNDVASLAFFEERGCCITVKYNDIEAVKDALLKGITSNKNFSETYDSINIEEIVIGCLSDDKL